MNWARLDDDVAAYGLFVMGVGPADSGSVALIGAAKRMWPIFTSSAEYSNGGADPLDRWSKRVIGQIAQDFAADDVYPSDGPPYPPFIAWSRATGRFWQSPTGMLVHDTAGLMISIRGALVWPGVTQHDAPRAANPCLTCADTPCISACPVGALSATAAYDVPRCKDHISAADGAPCMSGGCLTRQACPVSQTFDRDPDQSAFHMRAFRGA